MSGGPNGGTEFKPWTKAALDWADLQAGEFERQRDQHSYVAEARDYYEQAARHLRLLAAIVRGQASA